MTHLEQLYRAFGFLRRLTDEERAALEAVIKTRTLRRRQYILQAGDVCRHYTFVAEGCLRMYQTDEQGREHCVLFAVEEEWITDIGSMHNRKPSHFHIEAVEPATVLQIAREDLWQLWNRFHVFDRYFRVITEDAYSSLQQRLVMTHSLNGAERYRLFAEAYPQLVRRLPATQIASYLGITPEFLSKIKSDFLRRKS